MQIIHVSLNGCGLKSTDGRFRISDTSRSNGATSGVEFANSGMLSLPPAFIIHAQQ